MTQFPMNNNTPNGQTHTIMESPIWMGRLHSYWITFAVTWFVMFGLAGLLSYFKVPEGFGDLFFTSFPLLIALFIDEKFTQKFLMPAWELSKQDDHISIRGIQVPKVREWIEWHITVRKKVMFCIGSVHVILIIFSDNEQYVSVMSFIFISSIIMSSLVKAWIGFKKFGFMSWYFSNISTFKHYHKNL